MFERLRGQAPVTDERRVPTSFETVVLLPRLPISLYAGESRIEALSDRSTGEFSAEGSRVEWLPVKTRVWHNTRLQHFQLPRNELCHLTKDTIASSLALKAGVLQQQDWKLRIPRTATASGVSTRPAPGHDLRVAVKLDA